MFRFLPLCLYRGIKQNMAKPLLKKLAGFIEGEASLADKRSKRSPGRLAMIGDGETSVWRLWISKDDVATSLVVDLKTNLLESPEAT